MKDRKHGGPEIDKRRKKIRDGYDVIILGVSVSVDPTEATTTYTHTYTKSHANVPLNSFMSCL